MLARFIAVFRVRACSRIVPVSRILPAPQILEITEGRMFFCWLSSGSRIPAYGPMWQSLKDPFQRLYVGPSPNHDSRSIQVLTFWMSEVNLIRVEG